MNIPNQIDQISVSRAANAAHFEYMDSVRRRVEALTLDHALWRQAVEEFIIAFKAEDKAFKQFRDSELTDPIRVADSERDRLYASLRDAVKAFAKFPMAETADRAAPLLRVIKNYRITTNENYMRESGLIENMLQDLMQYRAELATLGLRELAIELGRKNDEVRRLIAERNEERMEQVIGALKTARRECDAAYAVVIFYTNAFAALNPEADDAQVLVMQLAEDLEYFRQHAMSDPNRNARANASAATGAQVDTQES